MAYKRDLKKNYRPIPIPSAAIPFIWGCMNLGVGLIVGAVFGVTIFLRISGGDAEVSQPISAPTLSADIVTPIADAAAIVEGEPASIEESSAQLFRIVSAESEARFSVYETFPEGVAIGRTDQIAGDILIDFNAPENSQVGTIRINLRSLQTDDPDRDRSIRCCVLLTAQDEYEFADFVPTALTGMPAQVEVGQAITFQVTGDFTVRGATRPVTFTVAVVIISPEEIHGSANAVINRNDFGILNDDKNAFAKHGVVQEVTLVFDFVARAVEN